MALFHSKSFRIAAGVTKRSSLFVAVILSACTTFSPTQQSHQQSIEIPLVPGWYEGHKVFYVTTDISDLQMANDSGANYVPRLANALPPIPPDPRVATSIDRIYKFFDGSQPSVLPSAPEPLGGGNRNDSYSPLWQLVKVTWLPGVTKSELRSEEEVLEAADAKRIQLERLQIIVNCPVVQVGDQLMKGTKLAK